MNELKPYKALCTAIACLMLAACAVQPTRVQHNTIPEAFAPSERENAYGSRVYRSLSDDYRIDDNGPQHDQLKKVFNHLAEAAGVDPNDWQIFLLDAPDVADIRAVQGNYIFVWSGIFDVVANEDELAGLLACEMAHELADHTDPVEFSAASELLFGITDAATTLGLLLLTQGAVNISGTGMTRWAYVEAADLDPVDRAYSDEQIEDMAAIALLIIEASDYSPDGLLEFWKRAEPDGSPQEKLKRLSREIPPQERLAIFEAVMPQLSIRQNPDQAPADLTGQTVDSGEIDSI